MQRRHLLLALAVSTLLGACGKSADNDAPLAFVPADTPYVYANLEPTPAAVTAKWSAHTHEYIPAALQTYENMLARIDLGDKPEARAYVAVARALIATLKTHDTWDKLRELGLKPDARVAIYGIGVVPVMRLELGDADKFRAAVADIERQSGQHLATAKIGTQEYWHVGNDKIKAIAAIEGAQLVVTLAPARASDSLKRTLLGLDRPAQNLADAGTLKAVAKQYDYSPYGEGYFDFVRLAQRLTGPVQGSDREFADALGLPTGGSDAACKSEYMELAHKFPRFVFGAEELDEQRIRIGATQEVAPALAQQLVSALGPAPGTGAPASGIVDFALSLPVLKLKDFWIAQADAVAAKPFTCAQLMHLNEGFAALKTKIDITVPPPASDLTGVRLTLDSLDLGDKPGAIPNVTGKLLLASSNPGVALAMAQLALPALKDVHLTADGKPVALPAGLVPIPNAPPLFAAMTGTAIGLAAGAGEDAQLGEFLSAPAARDATFMRMAFSGKLYGVMAQAFGKMRAALPADKQAQLASQAATFAVYEKWIRSGEFTLTATPNGIALRETIEQN
jgi:hypothetical protein